MQMKELAEDYGRLLQLLLLFPPAAVRSVFFLAVDSSFLEDSRFILNLQQLLRGYKAKPVNPQEQDVPTISVYCKDFYSLEPNLRTNAIAPFISPDFLSHQTWQNVMRFLVANRHSYNAAAAVGNYPLDPRLQPRQVGPPLLPAASQPFQGNLVNLLQKRKFPF